MPREINHLREQKLEMGDLDQLVMEALHSCYQQLRNLEKKAEEHNAEAYDLQYKGQRVPKDIIISPRIISRIKKARVGLKDMRMRLAKKLEKK